MPQFRWYWYSRLMAYKTAGKVQIKQLKDKQSILQYLNVRDRIVLIDYRITSQLIFFSSINFMPRVIIFCFTSLCSACMHSMPKTIHWWGEIINEILDPSAVQIIMHSDLHARARRAHHRATCIHYTWNRFAPTGGDAKGIPRYSSTGDPIIRSLTRPRTFPKTVCLSGNSVDMQNVLNTRYPK